MSTWNSWHASALALEHVDDSQKDEDLKDEGVGEDEWALEEGQEKRIIQKECLQDTRLIDLKRILAEWITTTLEHQRIIIRCLEEDLFDGQVLHQLIEHLAKIKIKVNEVTLTAMKQREKLESVVGAIEKVLGCDESSVKWTVELIHSKDLCAILHLLVAIATFYRAPIKLPENVILRVVKIRKTNNKLQHHISEEKVTSDSGNMIRGANERDAFDALFQLEPDKLKLVKKALIDFTNKHLGSLHLRVTDLDTQFGDGVFLIFLMGILENYFVPLYMYKAAPETFEDKVKNVKLAYELMIDAGLPKPTSMAEDVAKCELKATLRILYSLFTKYKTKSGKHTSPSKSPSK